MLVMGLAGSSTSLVRGGQGPDILIFQVSFVERLVCIIGSRGVYCVNKALKWFFS
jgi:hypothetical protein